MTEKIISLLLAALSVWTVNTTEIGTTEVGETVNASMIVIDQADAEILAKLVWGEARGVKSKAEQAAVIWCALNRVDAEGYACGRSVEYVVTFPNQFTGYRASNPVTPELYELAVDVLTRWQREKAGESNVGRVLPFEYQWFAGDGKRNHFRDAYRGGNRWDWSLPDPYLEESYD